MSKVTYPGVYREEVRNQSRVAQDVSSANLALVSSFSKGPVNEPVLVNSIGEAFGVFGDFWEKSLGPTMLASYYDNGGTSAYVVRVASDDAKHSNGCFEVYREFDTITMGTSLGDSVELQDTLEHVPVRPSSVSVDIFGEEIVTGDDINAEPDGDTLEFTLKETGISPESVTIEWTNSGGTQSTATDDGDGGFTGDVVTADSSIDYLTGEVVIEADSGFEDPSDATVDFRFISSEVRVVTVESVHGADFYNGSLDIDIDEVIALPQLIEFSWEDENGDEQVATFDGVEISGDASGEIDETETGYTYSLELEGNRPAEDSHITIRHLVANPRFRSVDDGEGGFSGDALNDLDVEPTIDYEDGSIHIETVEVDTESQVVVSYNQGVHCSRASNPGEFGDDYRLIIEGDENFVDSTTGDFKKFNVFIEEDRGDGFVELIGNFGSIELDDISSGKHIAQVLNDPFVGSNDIEMVPDYSDEIPTSLQGKSIDNMSIGRFGEGGTGQNLPGEIVSRVPVFDRLGIVPKTVEVTFGGNTITDDGMGGFEGDLDESSRMEVDYESGLLRFTPDGDAPDNEEVLVSYTLMSEDDEVSISYSGGDDGSDIERSDVVGMGLAAEEEGMYALDAVDEMLILALPDFAGDAQADSSVISYAESREDSMAIVTPPRGASTKQAKQYRHNVLASQSDRAAMYYPYILIEDPVTGRTKAVPPHGHVAGVWARTDRNRNVGKAPAGVSDGALNYIIDYDKSLNDSDVGELTKTNINALWQPPHQPRAVWGARTLEIGGEYRYIQRRRTVDFISLTVARSLWWAVFENNGPKLWADVSSQITETLRRFYSEGILAGATPEEAFFVQVDDENNPTKVVEAGQLIVDYGLATHTPAEFIRLRHQQITL